MIIKLKNENSIFNDNIFFQFREEIEVDNFLEIFSQCDGISGLAPLEKAKEEDLTFLTTTTIAGNKYIKSLQETKASYCLIATKDVNLVPKHIKAIIVKDPFVSFIELMDYLVIKKKKVGEEIGVGTIFNKEKVSIGIGVKIGKNCLIEDFVYIGNNCQIGDNCIIRANSTIVYSIIGNNCIIQSGAKIGQDGFGFVINKEGGLHKKIDHYGYVEIGDNVEIQANCCIDRGTYEKTFIGDNVKIDNLVQIGHNCYIDNGTFISGQCGLAGHVKIGKNCLIGGQSGFNNHVEIGHNSIVYGYTGVANSFPENSKIMAAFPGEDRNIWLKKIFALNKLVNNKKSKKSIWSDVIFFLKNFQQIIAMMKK